MSLMAGGDTTKRYNIPIEHLDFKYVETCTDIRELEKIYRILKSGEEGMYPDLIKFTEQRLETLYPKSRVLRKQEPLLRTSDLNKEELENVAADMKKWEADVREWQAKAGGDKSLADNIPPPRRSRNIVVSETKGVVDSEESPTASVKPASSGKKKGRVAPRSAEEWARLERQLEKEEKEEEDKEEAKKAAKKPESKDKAPTPLPFQSRVKDRLDIDNTMSPQERIQLSEKEKLKGNEAFRSGDYQEALVYYSRSISVVPQINVFNNRALTYVKLKKWDAAIKDCNKVIKSEPLNEKALLRRATSLTEVHRLAEARKDALHVLEMNPEESRAKKLLEDIEKEEKKREEKRQKGSRRLMIEESSSSEEEDDEDEVVQKQESKKEVDQKEETGGGRKMVIEEVDSSSDEEDEEAVEESCVKEQADPQEAVQETKLNDSVTEEKVDKKVENEEKEKEEEKESKKTITGVGGFGKSDIWSSDEVDKENIQPDIRPTGEQTLQSSHMSAPPPMKILSPKEEFLQQKELGNKCVKEQRYKEALKFYDRCVELCPEDPVGYNNRAVVNIHLDRPNDAIYDCNMTLDIQPNNVKALYRRGLARKMLGDYPDSLVDLRAAQVFDPLNKIIRKEIEDINKLLKETGGRRRLIIEEVEDDEEDEEEEEEEETMMEEVPVVREEWPEGLAREGSISAVPATETEATPAQPEPKTEPKTKGEETQETAEDIEKEIKAVEAAIEAELGSNWRQELEQEEETSRSLLREAIDHCVTESGQSAREAAEGEEENTEEEENSDSWVEVAEGMYPSDEEQNTPHQSRNSPVGAEESTPSPRKVQDGTADSHADTEDLPASPVTPYTLVSTLQSSRNAPTTAGKLLLRIVPEDLPQYLGTQLDEPALSSLISALHRFLMPRQEFALVWRFICSIVNVRRFSIVIMFISKTTKEELSDLFQTFEQIQEAGTLSMLTGVAISNTRRHYKV